MTQVAAQSVQRTRHQKSGGELVAYLLRLGGYLWNAESNAWILQEGRDDRAALAELRSGLGKKPGEMTRVHKHVVPYLPEEGFDDRWYYLVATLFGMYPRHRDKWSLGRAFGQLRDKSDSMEARFIALLNAHSDDLDDHLRHAVSLLRTNEQPFDWFQLFRDLLYWDHPERRVQLRWAQDFYRPGLSGDTSWAIDSAGTNA